MIVGRYTEPEGWVSMEDYMVHGVRKETGKTPIEVRLRMPPGPKHWVSAEDSFVHKMVKTAPLPPDESYILCLRKPPPEPPRSPEESYTIYDALGEVIAPTLGTEVDVRLEKMAQEDQREFDAGLITEDELERRRVASSIIRDNHGRRKDRIASWYLDTYFRLFENPKAKKD